MFHMLKNFDLSSYLLSIHVYTDFLTGMANVTQEALVLTTPCSAAILLP